MMGLRPAATFEYCRVSRHKPLRRKYLRDDSSGLPLVDVTEAPYRSSIAPVVGAHSLDETLQRRDRDQRACEGSAAGV
jgi:hypothetical protein